MKKLNLIYIPNVGASCIQHPHYDLFTIHKNREAFNIACILVTGKEEKKIIKEMVRLYNEKGNLK